VIEARDGKADPIAAVESRIGREKFVRSVAEAESLARPETTNNRAQLIEKYGTIRTFAPALLEAFEFRGGGAVNGLLRPITLIRDMYRAGKRALPDTPPTGFVRRAWRPFVFKDSGIDGKADELCALSELRDRLQAGDVWVDGSRQYQGFENYFILKPTFEILKGEGPLPLKIEADIERYLEDRRPLVGGYVDQDHIGAHWDEVLRLGTSIRAGTVSASTAQETVRLSTSERTGCGFCVNSGGSSEPSSPSVWLKSADLRRRTNTGLNKGEARNALARAVSRLGPQPFGRSHYPLEHRLS